MYNLEGKFALVTGAAKGIGKDCALRLAKEGADIAIADLPARATGGSTELLVPDDLQKVADEIKAMGRNVKICLLDVSKKDQVVSTIKDVVDSFGRIDFLVNVAGVGVLNLLEEVDEITDWDRTVDIDLKGVFLMCQAIAPYMCKQKYGKIVNMASIAGVTGSANLYPYNAAKAGVISLTQSLARGLGPFGINVNAVCPGYIWTPMWAVTDRWIFEHTFPNETYVPKQVYNNAIASTCLQKETTTDHVANMVAFLVSEESSVITGQHFNIDGGVEFH